MGPLVSVVMATYNGEKFIKESIQSVLDQTFKDFEFIIVDDGSTDATAVIISEFKDPRISYIKKDYNSGISESLNIGISNSKGFYVARMDDDDVCFPTRLELQLKVFEENKELIFCGSNVTDNNSLPLRTPECHDEILLELIFRNPIFHPTALIKREFLLTELYNTDAVPSEDYDLWSRLIFKGQFYQIQKPLLYCRVHQTSITANNRKKQLHKNIAVADYMFHKLGFYQLKNHTENLRIFVSHDYSINGSQLNELINWFDALQQFNEENKLFAEDAFNTMASANLNRYLFSYFTNRKLAQKIEPFLSIRGSQKINIIKFYAQRLFRKITMK